MQLIWLIGTSNRTALRSQSTSLAHNARRCTRSGAFEIRTATTRRVAGLAGAAHTDTAAAGQAGTFSDASRRRPGVQQQQHLVCVDSALSGRLCVPSVGNFRTCPGTIAVAHREAAPEGQRRIIFNIK